MWVNIVKVISPVCYEALRDPTVDCPVTKSSFIKLDDAINKYYTTYNIVCDPELVCKAGQIVIVRHDKDRRFYRARVETMIQRTSGYELLLYLVDTAEKITCPTTCVRTIHEDFLLHEHQAVTLRLPEINPCSRKLDVNTMKSEYRESDEWDLSAYRFIKDQLKKLTESRFETFKTTESGVLEGNLYFIIDGDCICVNDILVENNYGIRVFSIEATFSSDESCTELSLGASASSFCRRSKTPPSTSLKSSRSHSAMEEWHIMQKELERKYDSVDDECRIQTPSRSSASLSTALSPPKQATWKGKIDCEPKSPVTSPIALSPVPSSRSSGGRCVSRGTQYDPLECSAQSDGAGCLPKESRITEKTKTLNVPTDQPDSRPPSSAELLLSRVQKASNRKPQTQAIKDTRAVSNQETEETKSSNVPNDQPDSRPPSSAELLLSRVQKASNRKPQTQATKDTRAVSNPETEETKSSNVPTDKPDSRPPSSAELLLIRVQKALDRKPQLEASEDARTASMSSSTKRECGRKPETTSSLPISSDSKVTITPNPTFATVTSPLIPTCDDAKSGKAVCQTPTTRTGIGQTSDAPKNQSLPYRVPFGRGFPLKGISNPQLYIRPGSPAVAVTPSTSVVTKKTPTETFSAKPISHCPATFFRNNMVDPLGLLENVSCRKILICGSMAPKPVLDIPSSYHVIAKSLDRMGIKGPSIIQSYAWPAIMRGRNIAVISGPQSGKSMTYLPALVSLLLDNTLYTKLPRGNEPLALVVCSSWRSAQRVFDQCQAIVEGVGNIRAILIHGGGYDETQKIELINGCDILIATPCALLRLLSLEGTKPTSLNRLCYFVLDNADVLTEEFTEQLRVILREYISVLKKRGSIGTPTQIMAFSTKWTSGLKSFFNNIMANPLLYCASFHESVIYAGIQIVMHTFPENQKQERLLDFLKPSFKSNNIKTIICMSSADVAEGLYKILAFVTKHALVAHEDMPPAQVNSIREYWHGEHAEGNFPILIATDASLDELNIEDARCLIHYDIPEMSKSQFGFRFSCLLKYMQKPKTTNAVHIQSEPDCQSHIITTEKCVYQAHALISLMERLSGEIPQALKSLAEGFYRGREECKQPVPLCNLLKLYGHCPNQYWCRDRHMLLPETDKPKENVLRGAVVRIRVSDVRNATHFYGCILKRQLENGTCEVGYETFMLLNVDLNLYFANRVNHRPHGVPRIGDICAVLGKDESYYRVRILSQPSVKASNKVREVNVVYIDVGTLASFLVSDLLKLPHELQSVPPQAVEIFMTNIKPVDKDQEFTVKAHRMAHDLLHNEEIVGTVALSLGSTLWLKDVIKQTKLASTGDYVFDFDFRKKLLQQFAMDNPMHLPNLEKLCDGIFELQTPISIAIPSVKTRVVPAYAFLPLNEPVIVSISSVFSPGKFYLTSRLSLDCLEELMDELEEYFQEKQPPPAENVFEGMYCAARCPTTNDYYRARVLSVALQGSKPSAEDDVCIFWADYGENHAVKRKDIFSLPDKLLTKLPLQAIECSLANVIAVGESWTENASNFMWEQNLNEDGSYKGLLVKALKKISDPKQDGVRYVVELHDPSYSMPDGSFADLLCRANHAKLAPDFDLEYERAKVMDVPESQDVEYDEESHPKDQHQCDDPSKIQDAMDGPVKSAESLTVLGDLIMDSGPLSSYEEKEELSFHSMVNPKVVWWDTKALLNLKIHISGLKDHVFDLQPTHFLFKAIVKDVLYLVDINLFEEVEHEKFSLSVLENCVKIVIPKMKVVAKWPRLREEKTKTHWIEVDKDHVVDSSSDEENEWETRDTALKRTYFPQDEDACKSDSESYLSDNSDFIDNYEHSIF